VGERRRVEDWREVGENEGDRRQSQKEKRRRREKVGGRKESRERERRRGVGEDYPLSSPS
jgi:hypothetical protein